MSQNKLDISQYCKYYPQCTRGDACTFKHPKSAEEIAFVTGSKSQQKQKVCHYFLAGTCSRGDSCAFFHPPNVDQPQLIPNKADQIKLKIQQQMQQQQASQQAKAIMQQKLQQEHIQSNLKPNPATHKLPGGNRDTQGSTASSGEVTKGGVGAQNAVKIMNLPHNVDDIRKMIEMQKKAKIEKENSQKQAKFEEIKAKKLQFEKAKLERQMQIKAKIEMQKAVQEQARLQKQQQIIKMKQLEMAKQVQAQQKQKELQEKLEGEKRTQIEQEKINMEQERKIFEQNKQKILEEKIRMKQDEEAAAKNAQKFMMEMKLKQIEAKKMTQAKKENPKDLGRKRFRWPHPQDATILEKRARPDSAVEIVDVIEPPKKKIQKMETIEIRDSEEARWSFTSYTQNSQNPQIQVPAVQKQSQPEIARITVDIEKEIELQFFEPKNMVEIAQTNFKQIIESEVPTPHFGSVAADTTESEKSENDIIFNQAPAAPPVGLAPRVANQALQAKKIEIKIDQKFVDDLMRNIEVYRGNYRVVPQQISEKSEVKINDELKLAQNDQEMRNEEPAPSDEKIQSDKIPEAVAVAVAPSQKVEQIKENADESQIAQPDIAQPVQAAVNIPPIFSPVIPPQVSQIPASQIAAPQIAAPQLIAPVAAAPITAPVAPSKAKLTMNQIESELSTFISLLDRLEEHLPPVCTTALANTTEYRTQLQEESDKNVKFQYRVIGLNRYFLDTDQRTKNLDQIIQNMTEAQSLV